MESYEIYSSSGHLLDRKETLDDAYRCFKDWPQAAFVISRGNIIFDRDDLIDRETDRGRKHWLAN